MGDFFFWGASLNPPHYTLRPPPSPHPAHRYEAVTGRIAAFTEWHLFSPTLHKCSEQNRQGSSWGRHFLCLCRRWQTRGNYFRSKQTPRKLAQLCYSILSSCLRVCFLCFHVLGFFFFLNKMFTGCGLALDRSSAPTPRFFNSLALGSRPERCMSPLVYSLDTSAIRSRPPEVVPPRTNNPSGRLMTGLLAASHRLQLLSQRPNVGQLRLGEAGAGFSLPFLYPSFWIRCLCMKTTTLCLYPKEQTWVAVCARTRKRNWLVWFTSWNAIDG